MTHRDAIEICSLLKNSIGQINSVMKILEEERYCKEILDQILAVQEVLKKVNVFILQSYTQSCTKEAFKNGQEKEKIDEIITIIDKHLK